MAVDVDARKASVSIAGLVESKGRPMTDPFSGDEHRSRIHLPNGFEYTYAEMGAGDSKISADIAFDLDNSYGQFNVLHMNQDGVIR